jgi:hypothetical protein
MPCKKGMKFSSRSAPNIQNSHFSPTVLAPKLYAVVDTEEHVSKMWILCSPYWTFLSVNSPIQIKVGFICEPITVKNTRICSSEISK